MHSLPPPELYILSAPHRFAPSQLSFQHILLPLCPLPPTWILFRAWLLHSFANSRPAHFAPPPCPDLSFQTRALRSLTIFFFTNILPAHFSTPPIIFFSVLGCFARLQISFRCISALPSPRTFLSALVASLLHNWPNTFFFPSPPTEIFFFLSLIASLLCK